MARQLKQSAEEIAEFNEYKRREDRSSGFGLMAVRDKGWARLKNGVVVNWNVDRPLESGEARDYVPDEMIKIDGKLYDADELRSFLRWA